jgi:uncharacterized membrane protein YciS (DUF1049 family)
MCMGVQMFLAVLVIAVTLGAEPKLHIRAVLFRSAADGTFVFRDTCALSYIPLKFLPSVYLFRIHMDCVP